jgi:hypothetical protein
VDVGGVVVADAGVVVVGVVPGEEALAEHPCVSEAAEGVGEVGRYFKVLNWASE